MCERHGMPSPLGVISCVTHWERDVRSGRAANIGGKQWKIRCLCLALRRTRVCRRRRTASARGSLPLLAAPETWRSAGEEVAEGAYGLEARRGRLPWLQRDGGHGELRLDRGLAIPPRERGRALSQLWRGGRPRVPRAPTAPRRGSESPGQGRRAHRG